MKSCGRELLSLNALFAANDELVFAGATWIRAQMCEHLFGCHVEEKDGDQDATANRCYRTCG